MCGICGIIRFDKKPIVETKIKLMMQNMKHRGPDDEGLFVADNVCLGHVRLSIIDLSPLGHQPMFSDDGCFVIVYNGEVYNYIELRQELIAKGYKFRSNTDTEVVINAYIEWGAECLNKFNGMWAFVIYNKVKKELFCARDRYGIKPFYYYFDNEQFIFASEISPILTLLEKKPTPNNQTIFDYLVFNRTDQTEQTFFNEIKKLQHGHSLSIQNADFRIQKWYNLRERVSAAKGFKSGEEFKEVFKSAIEMRLRSDVPIGVCLSGGLDSSSIVSVMIKDFNKIYLNTFSAIYGKGNRGDESEFIDEYKPQLVNMFFTSPSANSLLKDISIFVKAHCEPIPSTSPYAQFKVMELAKDNAVVTLDGQGADEELAGYHYFFGFYFKDLFRNYRWVTLLKEMLSYLGNHNSIYGLKTFFYFLMPLFVKTRTRVVEKGYLQLDFVNSYFKNNTIASSLYNSSSLNDALLDHFEYKLEHLLKWEDRNSMWFSLESRVPFLDYRLVEKTLATSSDMKIKKGMTKNILREAMLNILPEKIRLRKDKIGFITPEDEWFREKKFKEYINQILNSESLRSREIINTDKAKILYEKHLNKEIQISKEIWKWLNLELWYREFID